MTTPGAIESEPAASGPPGPPNEITEGPVLFAVRAQLFLSSYLPLFVILAVRFDGVGLKWTCAVLAGLGALDLGIIFSIARTTQAQRRYADRIDDASPEVAGYLASYLVPFVTVATPSTGDLVGYGIFFAVLLAIFLRSNMSQINPTLYVFGFRLATITLGSDRRYLVCRALPRAQRDINVVPVAGLLIYRKESRGEQT
jgi:hypothetical protein